jgi:hypothetical protein
MEAVANDEFEKDGLGFFWEWSGERCGCVEGGVEGFVGDDLREGLAGNKDAGYGCFVGEYPGSADSDSVAVDTSGFFTMAGVAVSAASHG